MKKRNIKETEIKRSLGGTKIDKKKSKRTQTET